MYRFSHVCHDDNHIIPCMVEILNYKYLHEQINQLAMIKSTKVIKRDDSGH